MVVDSLVLVEEDVDVEVLSVDEVLELVEVLVDSVDEVLELVEVLVDEVEVDVEVLVVLVELLLEEVDVEVLVVVVVGGVKPMTSVGRLAAVPFSLEPNTNGTVAPPSVLSLSSQPSLAPAALTMLLTSAVTSKESVTPLVVPVVAVPVAAAINSPPAGAQLFVPLRLFQVTPASVQVLVRRWAP